MILAHVVAARNISAAVGTKQRDGPVHLSSAFGLIADVSGAIHRRPLRRTAVRGQNFKNGSYPFIKPP
jgi:hypothetical protein